MVADSWMTLSESLGNNKMGDLSKINTLANSWFKEERSIEVEEWLKTFYEELKGITKISCFVKQDQYKS